MLRSIKDLEGFAVSASDGHIGHVRDFYFDDQAWVIRYVIVEAGGWLASQQALVSPISIGKPDWSGRLLSVSITKQQVKDSPGIGTEEPVSLQNEIGFSGHRRYPYQPDDADYWHSCMDPNPRKLGCGSSGAAPGIHSKRQATHARTESARSQSDNAHLRCCRVVMQYHVHASDGDLGHVAGLIVDDETWAIRYLIVDTSNLWLGHQVLVAPQWIEAVRWSDAKVTLSMTRQAIKDAPPTGPKSTSQGRISLAYRSPGKPRLA